MRGVSPPRENEPLIRLEGDGFRGTVQLHDLVPDFGRLADEQVYLAAFGYDHSLYSFWPVERRGEVRFFCGLHAARRIGKQRFTTDELALVSAAFEQSPTLRSVPNRAWLYPALLQMQAGYRVAVALFVHYKSPRLTAAAMDVSEDDVRVRLKRAAALIGWTRPQETILKTFDKDEPTTVIPRVPEKNDRRDANAP